MTDLPDLIDLTPNGLHQPFLEKAVDGDEHGPEGMLAAFLTLRVVDQFATGNALSEATVYQIQSTKEYLDRLDADSPECSYLTEIVRAASEAVDGNRPALMQGPLTRFADWLEKDLQLAQALDVLNTGVRVLSGSDSALELQLQLRRARVLRRMGLFAEASEAYSVSDHLANEVGDQHNALLAQIGQGKVLQGRGNLPAARTIFEKVRDKAVELNDRDAAARASHDLAVNCIFQGRYEEAALEAYQAFQMYDDSESQRSALSDLAVALTKIGNHDAARDAFEVVLAQESRQAQRVNVILELMGIATHVGDRMAFERSRRWLDAVYETLPAGPRADFEIKVGLGLARFGNLRAARTHLERAVAHAEATNLNRYLFDAEDALRDVEASLNRVADPVESEKVVETRSPGASTPGDATWTDEISEVSRSLKHLRQEVEISAGV